MQQEAQFLNYRPSQRAAASLLLSINISQSNVAHIAGIEKIDQLTMRSYLQEKLTVHDSLIQIEQ